VISEPFPVVAMSTALAAVGIGGTLKLTREGQNREERRKNKQLLELAMQARPPGSSDLIKYESSPQEAGPGPFFVIGQGTVGLKLASRWLEELNAAGKAHLVGVVLLVELDARWRQRFEAQVADVFRNRIVFVKSASLSGGLGNRKYEHVLNLIGRWGPALLGGIQAARDLYLKRNFGREPSVILMFGGFGGSAPLGVFSIKELSRLFKNTKSYAALVLPSISNLRRRAKYVIEQLKVAGLDGVVLADNAANPVLNDAGLVTGLAVLAAGSDEADAPIEANNALYHAFADGSWWAAIQTSYQNLPAYPVLPDHPDVPPQYFTPADAVDAGLVNAFETLDDPEGHSLGGVGQGDVAPGTCTYDLIMSPILPDRLRLHVDNLVQARELMGFDKCDRSLVFASIPTLVDPTAPRCPLVVVTLQTLAHPEAALEALGASESGLEDEEIGWRRRSVDDQEEAV